MSRYYFQVYFLGEESEAWSLSNLPRITKPSYFPETRFKYKFSDLKQDLEVFHFCQQMFIKYQALYTKMIKMAWGNSHEMLLCHPINL